MNLYLVTRHDDWSFDDYESFVVCCNDEETARKTHPESLIYEEKTSLWYLLNDDGDRYYIPDRPGWIKGKYINNLKVEHIGIANENITPGILIRNYHAG